MSDLPIHPALVHLPLGIAFAVPLVTLVVLAGYARGALPRLTWSLPVLLQVLVFVGAFAAMREGHEDEEKVESVVPESAIEEHEERGEAFVWLSGFVLLGLVGAAGVPRRDVALGLGAVSAVAGIGLAGLGVSVGHAGGELVYVHGAAEAHRNPAAPGAADRDADED